MTSHSITLKCDSPRCHNTETTEAEEQEKAPEGGAIPPAPVLMPNGWRRVQVREITRRHTMGQWKDVCPECAKQLDWILPIDRPLPLGMQHQAGIASGSVDSVIE